MTDVRFRAALAAALMGLLAGSTGSAAAQTGARDVKGCVTEEAGFKTRGKSEVYEIVLTNSCGKPLVCVVTADVTTAAGGKAGKAVISIPRQSKRGPGKATYRFKVKAPGGTAKLSRDCKEM